MKQWARSAIVVVLLGCAVGLWWMFSGGYAPIPAQVDKSNVAGGVAGILALALAVTLLWPKRTAGQDASPTQDPVEYLARETLLYWQDQAKARKLATPSPASVRWAWTGDDVAVPADQLRPALLTAGVVTQLRQQLYQRLGRQGRLVILGGSGAGKTTAMLLLLIDILQHRREGSSEPVPVWLTLGGWNPDTTPLQTWAADRLNRDYPDLAARGGPDAATELIRTGRVALFLDGLDEMAPALQSRALEAIDRATTGQRLVLTSRPGEYKAAVKHGRLWTTAVIDVLPVDIDHAEAFLLAELLGDHRTAWQQVIDRMRTDPDNVPARTLTTPLALALARDTYLYADPTELLDPHAHPTPEALLQHLLTRSLTLAYPDETERQHAIRWLSWIAHHMGANRDLRWWDIPTWTPGRSRRLVAGLMVGLAGGLVTGIMIGLTGGLTGGIVTGLAGGLVTGFVAKHSEEPQQFVVRSLHRGEISGLLTAGLLLGLFAGLGVAPTLGLRGGLVFGPVFGVTVGFGLGLMSFWSRPLPTAQAAGPIEIYRSDRRKTLVAGFTNGLMIAVVAGIGFVASGAAGYEGWTGAGVAVGTGGALMSAFMVELGPTGQLTATELLWRLRGQRVRFMPLLQVASDRHVLRQAGAVYQFRHAALQDLLADGEQTPRSGSPEN